jgi:hypothetical protein
MAGVLEHQRSVAAMDLLQCIQHRRAPADLNPVNVEVNIGRAVRPRPVNSELDNFRLHVITPQ